MGEKQSQLLLRPTEDQLSLQVWSGLYPARAYTTLVVFVVVRILILGLPLALADQLPVLLQILTVVVTWLQVNLLYCMDYNQ